VQHWIGNDDHKLWLKTEGDYFGDQDIFGRADLQMLYSRNIDTLGFSDRRAAGVRAGTNV
jgi:copper resistance protein B